MRSAGRLSGRGIVWDAGATGLGFKVLPSGKKLWVMQLRWPGREMQTVKNLGVYPVMSLAAARERAGQFYALAKAGIDPFEAEERARAEELAREEADRRAEALRNANTFVAVAERYIDGRAGNRRAGADAQEIRRLLVAEWGERPVHEIAPRDVRQLIERHLRRSAYGAQGGVDPRRRHLQAGGPRGADRDLAARLARQAHAVQERRSIAPRQRTLSDEEVFALWRASGRLGYPAGPIYRLLLLTGCRLNEIADAKWSELHPELRRVLREAARVGRAGELGRPYRPRTRS